ncbi:hypothetical protein C2845_PM03G13830 [Panicum miliaceum]|uniref:Uncharacterized protein n=1 Tax=Panicum miliaceum TaxID=4540 RepID=A0A3L6TGG4_PANMI|nr:hypothetical protein C2845_PM03G13830 [Panicum miliaceum]
MGLEMLVARDGQLPRSACRYQRLRGELGGEGGDVAVFRSAVMARRPRPLRLRRRSCKAAGIRWRVATVARGGKAALRLRLMRLVLLLPARRLAALVAELVRRLAAAVAASAAGAAADCPAIVFSSQWGLPVLSHSASTSRNSRLRAFYLERSLSGGSGAGSPC